VCYLFPPRPPYEILTPVSPSLYQREGEEKDEGAGAPSSSPAYVRVIHPTQFPPFEKGGIKGDLKSLSLSLYEREKLLMKKGIARG